MKTKILALLFFFQIGLIAGENPPMNKIPGFDISPFDLFEPNALPVKFYNQEEGHFFLSNFFPAEVSVFGHIFPTSEHAYQSQKFKPESKTFNEFFEPENRSAEAAYRLGKKKTDLKFKTMELWNLERDKIMYEVILAKFTQNEDLRELLLETDPSPLIEWTKAQSSGNDTFWGINSDSLQGKNHLGKLLMLIRGQFKGKVEPSEIEKILNGLKADNFIEEQGPFSNT